MKTNELDWSKLIGDQVDGNLSIRICNITVRGKDKAVLAIGYASGPYYKEAYFPLGQKIVPRQAPLKINYQLSIPDPYVKNVLVKALRAFKLSIEAKVYLKKTKSAPTKIYKDLKIVKRMIGEIRKHSETTILVGYPELIVEAIRLFSDPLNMDSRHASEKYVSKDLAKKELEAIEKIKSLLV